jgi:hypothetical protein
MSKKEEYLGEIYDVLDGERHLDDCDCGDCAGGYECCIPREKNRKFWGKCDGIVVFCPFDGEDFCGKHHVQYHQIHPLPPEPRDKMLNY